MTEEEFRKRAEEFGYTQEEIEDLMKIHKDPKTPVPFEEIPLFEHIYD